MKIRNELVKWFKNKYRLSGAPHFKIEMVSEFPWLVKGNTIFIVKDGKEADTLIFKCPCGCGTDIYLNLLKDTRPNWNYYITKEKITIVPSIWKTTGCQSHFYIEGGITIWLKSKYNY
jgi:hypothetical protein